MAPLKPAKVLVVGFLSVIVVGTVLLLLPVATAEGNETNVLTALFTATSAVCVTGLIVVDTGTHWSTFGQVVILCLIQVGGLGIMTMSTAAALLIGRKITLRERLLIRESMGHISLEGMVRLVRLIVIATLTLEGIGALILTLRWSQDYSLGRAAYLGVFHSVSAFNNAGFDLFTVSLMPYVGDLVTNVTVITLIFSGGIGFVVFGEIYRAVFLRSRMALHSKVVLTVSAALLLVGAVFIFAAESTNAETMGNLSWPARIMSSVFTSVTPRTAGFNTIPTGSLRYSSLFFLMILMFIGGSSGSTAGGVKTTTVYALVATMTSTIRRSRDVTAFRRRLDPGIIRLSLTIIMLSIMVVCVTTLILLSSEGGPFVECLFEAFSAFGTVGLSTGITPQLSTVGRLVIIVTMFTGRLGPLTMTMAMADAGPRRTGYRHPREDIMIG